MLFILVRTPLTKPASGTLIVKLDLRAVISSQSHEGGEKRHLQR
jgi:hypothetical protein